MQEPLSHVNKFLNSKTEIVPVEQEVVVVGPDAVKNIFVNEINKINKLESLSNDLIAYISDAKAVKQLSYKQKQELLRTVNDIASDSRNFVFRMAELASKNEFLKRIMEINEGSKTIIQSSSGETYVSSIDDETRRNLTELLRDVVNSRCQGS